MAVAGPGLSEVAARPRYSDEPDGVYQSDLHVLAGLGSPDSKNSISIVHKAHELALCTPVHTYSFCVTGVMRVIFE